MGISKGCLGVVLPDGQRSGVTAETLKNMTSRQMQIQEARKILGIEDNLPWPDTVKVKIEGLMFYSVRSDMTGCRNTNISWRQTRRTDRSTFNRKSTELWNGFKRKKGIPTVPNKAFQNEQHACLPAYLKKTDRQYVQSNSSGEKQCRKCCRQFCVLCFCPVNREMCSHVLHAIRCMLLRRVRFTRLRDVPQEW